MTLTSKLAPPSDRRQRRSAEIRERLFRSALALFAEKGFAETTVEDITEAADVGKGTFFNYFPSKDHILLAFGEMQLGKLEAAVDEARRTNEPMPQFLGALGVRMTQEPTRNPEIIRAVLQAYLSRSEEHTSELQSQSNLVCRLLLEKKKKSDSTYLRRPGWDAHLCAQRARGAVPSLPSGNETQTRRSAASAQTSQLN